MADVQIKVDARQALAKLNRVYAATREALQENIPPLLEELAARVNDKLDSELKSRTHIEVDTQMKGGDRFIFGTVTARWTGDTNASMVPQVLESGARAHPIEAVHAKALAFFWNRLGQDVFFKRVWHPGFPGIYYMERSAEEMRDEIRQTIKDAVQLSARRVR